MTRPAHQPPLPNHTLSRTLIVTRDGEVLLSHTEHEWALPAAPTDVQRDPDALLFSVLEGQQQQIMVYLVWAATHTPSSLPESQFFPLDALPLLPDPHDARAVNDLRLCWGMY